jgi:hypothetical protein
VDEDALTFAILNARTDPWGSPLAHEGIGLVSGTAWGSGTQERIARRIPVIKKQVEDGV